MENTKQLKIKRGNMAYFLFNERKQYNTQPIGFFGKVVNLETHAENQTFDVRGYELFMPVYNVLFENNLIVKNGERPSVIVPRNSEQTPRAYFQEIEKNIQLVASLDDFFSLLRERKFEPNANLYGNMQKAIKKLQRA